MELGIGGTQGPLQGTLGIPAGHWEGFFGHIGALKDPERCSWVVGLRLPLLQVPLSEDCQPC